MLKIIDVDAVAIPCNEPERRGVTSIANSLTFMKGFPIDKIHQYERAIKGILAGSAKRMNFRDRYTSLYQPAHSQVFGSESPSRRFSPSINVTVRRYFENSPGSIAKHEGGKDFEGSIEARGMHPTVEFPRYDIVLMRRTLLGLTN